MSSLIESSIFSFLADLDEDIAFNSATVDKSTTSHKNLQITVNSVIDARSTSHPSFEMNEVLMLQKGIEIAIRQHEELSVERTESREIYICDFNECCCECCCEFWLKKIYERYVLSWVRRIWKKAKAFYLKQIKYICVYSLLIGTFIYHPMRNIGAFIVNGCNRQMIDNEEAFYFIEVFFAFIDFLCGALSLVLFLFTVSFLGTRNEFLKTYLFDKGYRARMIFFHYKKAKIYGFMYICTRMAYKIAFFYEYPMNDVMESSYTLVFMIFINVYLLLSINLLTAMKIMPIEQDCRILRAHAQYFAIQNNLLKSTPRANDVYKFIKKQIKKRNKLVFLNLRKMEEKLMKSYRKMVTNLKEELVIIEEQNFKNIAKNTRYSKYLSVFLLILMVGDLLLTSVCCMILLLRNTYPEIWLHNLDYTAKIGISILSLFECTLLPFLIFYCLKKKTFSECK